MFVYTISGGGKTIITLIARDHYSGALSSASCLNNGLAVINLQRKNIMEYVLGSVCYEEKRCKKWNNGIQITNSDNIFKETL